ncbi:DUF4247 domain-containing protein [Rhodococcus sp. CX]|uniref:DUF4247 domain-containing protein n=2 Tax=unclassified Rhodococcus (in: high G+C Gram-positive bacteria) TaxID=192944 RepID=UPI0035A89278
MAAVKRMFALIVLGAMALAVAGCGAPVRDWLADTYELRDRNGDVATYYSPDPVGITVANIVDEMEPAARSADGGREYLRYDDDIVTVGAAPGGGSTITVEDLGGRYSSGGYAYLGPGFTPGSPAAGNTSGGSGDAK